MSSAIVDQVRSELLGNKITKSKCPECGSRELFAVTTHIYKCDMVSEKSEVVSRDGVLLDIYCDCGWSIGGYDNGEVEEE